MCIRDREIVVLFGSMTILLALSLPIGISLGMATAITLVYTKSVPLIMIAQNAFAALDSFPLLAIPFFMLAGALMSYGGISKRLVSLAEAMVGAVIGGLAMVTVTACMFFAAIDVYKRQDDVLIGYLNWSVRPYRFRNAFTPLPQFIFCGSVIRDKYFQRDVYKRQTGASTILPSTAMTPLPSRFAFSAASTTRIALRSSFSSGMNALCITLTWLGWMQALPVKPRPTISFVSRRSPSLS